MKSKVAKQNSNVSLTSSIVGLGMAVVSAGIIPLYFTNILGYWMVVGPIAGAVGLMIAVIHLLEKRQKLITNITLAILAIPLLFAIIGFVLLIVYFFTCTGSC